MLEKSKSVKKQSNLHGKEVLWQAGRRQSCCPEDWTTVEQWRGICYSLFSLEKPASVASPGVTKVAQHSNAFCEYQIKLLIQSDGREKDGMKKETEMAEERRDTVWVLEGACIQVCFAKFKCMHLRLCSYVYVYVSKYCICCQICCWRIITIERTKLEVTVVRSSLLVSSLLHTSDKMWQCKVWRCISEAALWSLACIDSLIGWRSAGKPFLIVL